MRITKNIKQWAFLCESEENQQALRESALEGEILNGEIAKSLKDMLRMYKWRMIRAVYVNDNSFISKDYEVGKDSVDFKKADKVINDNTLKLKDMIKVLEENPEKFSTFEGKRINGLDYDIEDSDGSYLPYMSTDDSNKELNETDFPCTDGFPQAEKDICTCPDCGEKLYENDEEIPELQVNETEESKETITKEDELTLKEFFDKAKKENAVLQVHFVKVTDNKERTVIFSNSADVGTRFEDSKTVSPKVLKTITKNHDRVFEQDVTYTGSLVTFPERITEDTPHVTQDHEAADGTKWQWRRLYIEQIIDVKYNDKVVWENNGLFNFNLVGKDGKIRTTVSKDELDKKNADIEKYNLERERRDAEFKVLRKKAVELAKSLTEEQCSVNIGYAATNGFDVLSEEAKIMTLAIEIKHDQLCRTNPEKHKMVDTSRNPTRGDHESSCKGCKYRYAWDSSD